MRPGKGTFPVLQRDMFLHGKEISTAPVTLPSNSCSPIAYAASSLKRLGNSRMNSRSDQCFGVAVSKIIAYPHINQTKSANSSLCRRAMEASVFAT